MEKEPVTCEYFVDGRLCKAVIELPEVRTVRKEFCKNSPKDYCCYLCSHRENCEIACSYLDTPRESTSIDSSVFLKVERQIKKYEEEKVKLSVFFANGKIGERSYLAATKTLESKVEELKKVKESPVLSQETVAVVHKLDEFEQAVSTKPTALWYLVPFFFGIIGGIIAYICTKDEDRGMADSLLIFGIIWAIILVGSLLYYAILSGIQYSL